MSDARWAQLCTLFDQARDLTSSARAALLATQPSLRADVEELLTHHDRAEGPLAGPAALAPGARIGDHEVLSLLGSGGMGSVYEALGPSGRVALKVLHPHVAGIETCRERFHREGILGQRVVHENVVRTLGTEGEDGLVMELVPGQTLDAWHAAQGVVSEAECRRVALGVARGLVAIHAARIVHRDLKPQNVLLTPDGVVKLMDFGTALPIDERMRLSRRGQFVGTVRYCAPEQLGSVGGRPDGRADLYALGLVLHELFGGAHPLPTHAIGALLQAHQDGGIPPLSAVRAPVSSCFEDLVQGLLARDPDDRIPSAARVVEILEAGI